MSKLAMTIAILVMSLFVLPVQALACACCSNGDEYRIAFRKATAFEQELLRSIKFGDSATRIETANSAVEEVTYQLTGNLAGKTWNFNLRDGSKMGTLTLTVPLKMLAYVVDPHDGQTSPGGGPRLYKEWRFEGRANATGFLRRGSSPTSYFLVFQGHGNSCDSPEDFSHWRLEVKGPRVKYALTGALATATAQAVITE